MMSRDQSALSSGTGNNADVMLSKARSLRRVEASMFPVDLRVAEHHTLFLPMPTAYCLRFDTPNIHHLPLSFHFNGRRVTGSGCKSRAAAQL